VRAGQDTTVAHAVVEGEINRLGRFLLIVYLVETGLVLLVAPWSTFWERNLLAETVPLVDRLVRLAVVRGAVSGVGTVSLCAGIWEIVISVTMLVRHAGASARHGPGKTRPWIEER
jgi:hypothetical protein